MVDATTAVTLGKLLAPLIKDLYEGAKKIGSRGFQRWEQRGFATKIGSRIKSIENVRTIWKPDAISLLKFFHPPKVVVNGKAVFATRVNDIQGNATVLEGIVGQGKSVLLRSLAVQEILSNDAKTLPLFIELKDLTSKSDLIQTIFKKLESFDIDVDEDTLNYLFKSGKLSLLLDGFDELEEALVKATFLDIEHLALRYPELKIIVTSRPGREIQKSPLFSRLPIAPLTFSEFPAFLQKLGVAAEKSVSLRAAIKNSPSKVSNLITTPLMLTLVVMVYEAESQIPDTLPEFFSRLFQTVFSRHDHLKAAFTRKHHSGLSEKALQELFETFCFMTIQSGYGRTLSKSEFDEIYQSAIEYSDHACDSEKFRLDIVKVACLMLDDGIDSTSFLHKSILEYFSSAFIKRLSEENAIHFYTAAIKKSKEWEEVLRFLKSIDSFRYSRHYLIPTIEKEKKEIFEPISDGTDESLISMLKKTQPKLGIYFKESSNGSVDVGAYGDFTPRQAEYLVDLNDLMIEGLLATASTINTVDDLETNFRLRPSSNDGVHGIHVPIHRLLQVYGTKYIRQILAKYETALTRMENEAMEIVGKEKKKSLIFERKKSV